ncbi:hypothetical protein AB0E83_08385 [Streptomyces sp. NPDC035033]|uniref:hypothetical protein n=1 Tax=Streptomyces sp. NPDC035033 TaxID=3155368 RepID=UPI0033D65C50
MNEEGFGPSLLGAAVVLAVLVIRTAVGEMRHPGSAHRAWGFLHTRRGLVTLLVTSGALAATAWATAGPSSLPWVLLAALLIARLSSDSR